MDREYVWRCMGEESKHIVSQSWDGLILLGSKGTIEVKGVYGRASYNANGLVNPPACCVEEDAGAPWEPW